MKCLVESNNSMTCMSIGKYNWLTDTLKFNGIRGSYTISREGNRKNAFGSLLICAVFFLTIAVTLGWSLMLLAGGDVMRPLCLLLMVFVYSAMSLAPLAQEHAPAPESEAVLS
jgi:hypothetical protein